MDLGIVGRTVRRIQLFYSIFIFRDSILRYHCQLNVWRTFHLSHQCDLFGVHAEHTCCRRLNVFKGFFNYSHSRVVANF